jgi:hypothetical protein
MERAAGAVELLLVFKSLNRHEKFGGTKIAGKTWHASAGSKEHGRVMTIRLSVAVIATVLGLSVERDSN